MKNKFNFLVATFTLVGVTSFAQVGIGTSSPDTSSILELQASDKGLLLPRVDLTDVTSAAPLAAHVQGMVVYNTAKTITGYTGNAEGVWRNDGTEWIKVEGSATGGAGWSLTGNAGTTAGTNFMGTLDDQDIVFKRDKIVAGQITFGPTVGTQGGYNVSLGVHALENNPYKLNTAIGTWAIQKLTNGARNSVLGGESLMNLTDGDENVVIGAGSATGLIKGSGNIIVGSSQDAPSTASNDFLNIGGAIFGTGLTGDQSAPAGNIGIGKVAPAEKLDVAGSFHNQTQLASGRYTGFYSGLNTIGGGYQSSSIYNMPNPTIGAGQKLNYVTVQDDHVQMGTTEDVAGLVGSNAHIASYPGELQLVADTNVLDNFSYFHLRPIDKGKTYWNSVQDPSGTNNSTTIDFDAASSIAFKFSTAGVYSEYRFPRTDGTANQVLKTDGLGNLSWGSAGGGGDLTNDAFINNAGSTRVELGTQSDGSTARTAGTEFVITDSGKVGIGITTPTSKLEVNGDATNYISHNAGAGTTIDFSKSNLAYTSASPGNTFTLQNVKDGGTYTLAVQGTTSGTAAFTASGFTVHPPVDNAASAAGKHTVYTFVVIGTHVYTSWITGY